MENNFKISKRNEFKTQRDFDKYMLAVKYAQKINQLIAKGFLIMDKDGNILKNGKLCFNYMGAPTVGFRKTHKIGTFKTSCYSDITVGVYEDSPEYFVYFVYETKNQIIKKFSNYQFVNPKDIKKLSI